MIERRLLIARRLVAKTRLKRRGDLNSLEYQNEMPVRVPVVLHRADTLKQMCLVGSRYRDHDKMLFAGLDVGGDQHFRGGDRARATSPKLLQIVPSASASHSGD